MIKESIAALSLTNDPNGKFEAFVSFPLTTQMAMPSFMRDFSCSGAAMLLHLSTQPVPSCGMDWCMWSLCSPMTAEAPKGMGEQTAAFLFFSAGAQRSGTYYLLKKGHRFLQATWAPINAEITAHDVTGQFRKTNWLEEENECNAPALWLNYFLFPSTGWGLAGKTWSEANGDASWETRT